MTWCQAFTLLLPPQDALPESEFPCFPLERVDSLRDDSRQRTRAPRWPSGGRGRRLHGEGSPPLSISPPHPGASVGCVIQTKGARPGQGAVRTPLSLAPTPSRRSDAQRRPHEHPTVLRGAATLQGLGDLTFPRSPPHITTCLSLLPLLQGPVSRSRHPGSVTTHVLYSWVKLQRAAMP